MKKASFTLLEVMVAAAIIALVTVMLSAFLGGSFKQLNEQNTKRDRLNRSVNTMESYMAYEDKAEPGMHVVVTSYDDQLEKVEVFDEKTGKSLLVSIRPKKSLYTP